MEWPSGLIQELHDVAVNQTLTVTEYARSSLQIKKTPKGVKLAWPSLDYLLEQTDDLAVPDWQAVPAISGTSHEVALEARQFFRLKHR